MAFLLLGKPLIWSFSLAILAGITAGYIITGWQSKELPTEQKISPELAELKENKDENKKETQTEKRQSTGSRRQLQKSWFFWKNPQPRKKRR